MFFEFQAYRYRFWYKVDLSVKTCETSAHHVDFRKFQLKFALCQKLEFPALEFIITIYTVLVRAAF